jgi:hypothetical protein
VCELPVVSMLVKFRTCIREAMSEGWQRTCYLHLWIMNQLLLLLGMMNLSRPSFQNE